jgi:hypothetical protein
VVVCTAAGKSCCEYNLNTGRITSCESIRASIGGSIRPPAGSFQLRAWPQRIPKRVPGGGCGFENYYNRRQLLLNAAIAASRLTARAAGLRERLRHAQSLPRISSSSRKPCAMPIMLRPMDISATIDA